MCRKHTPPADAPLLMLVAVKAVEHCVSASCSVPAAHYRDVKNVVSMPASGVFVTCPRKGGRRKEEDLFEKHAALPAVTCLNDV